MFYRYETRTYSRGVDEFDESLGSFMKLECLEFEVTKVTPKGARITGWFYDLSEKASFDPLADSTERLVMDHYKNKYAYPTKEEALLGFIARKRREQKILLSRINDSQQALLKAQIELQEKLKSCAP